MLGGTGRQSRSHTGHNPPGMQQENPTRRVLALLELLQAKALSPGPELAQALGVDVRTLRRYIGHLVELGIPVAAQRGRDGGYGLSAGHKLPPLMFNSDEALALAMGLRAARELGLDGMLPAVHSSRAKLERVLPAAVKRRLSDVHETVALDLRRSAAPSDGRREGVQAELALLSAAARTQQRVSLRYQDRDGSCSERQLDVYGLGLRGGAWYAVGFCHLRQALRSFRLDRVLAVQPLAASFGRPAEFDVLAFLNEALARLPRAHRVRLLLHTGLDSARRALYPELGLLQARAEGGVELTAQIDDLASLARELAALPFDFEILEPAALRHALADHARALLRRSQD